MKIVDFETFIRLPAGTIFSPFKGGECWEIKTDTGEPYIDLEGKYNYSFMGAMPIIPFVLGDVISGNELGTYKTEYSIYDAAPCDYLNSELFMVLEKHEIKEMITKLEWALNDCKNIEEIDEYL